MEREEIRSEIRSIVNKVINNNGRLLEDADNLLYNANELNYRDLVYIVIEIMENFKVCFEPKDFEEYQFTTIDTMTDAVIYHLGKNNEKQ